MKARVGRTKARTDEAHSPSNCSERLAEYGKVQYSLKGKNY